MSLGSGLVGFGCLEGLRKRTLTRALCKCKVEAAEDVSSWGLSGPFWLNLVGLISQG